MNNDLISRLAAIDAFLTELVKRERTSLLHTWSTVEVKYFIAKILELMPSAQRWIPVTEKPIDGGQYIVTLKDDKEVWTDIAEWNPTFGGRWQAEFFDCEYRDIDNVVAWMPLPAPYAEKGDE